MYQYVPRLSEFYCKNDISPQKYIVLSPGCQIWYLFVFCEVISVLNIDIMKP